MITQTVLFLEEYSLTRLVELSFICNTFCVVSYARSVCDNYEKLTVVVWTIGPGRRDYLFGWQGDTNHPMIGQDHLSFRKTTLLKWISLTQTCWKKVQNGLVLRMDIDVSIICFTIFLLACLDY